MSDSIEQLNNAAREIWDTNAAWWDGVYGEGNAFQRELIGPATERLLDLRPGETVLDAACGNGAFARYMAARGINVVAFDFSEVFLQKARERTAGTEYSARIEYHRIDATDEAALMSLGGDAGGRFDAAVCTMALMDMATIEPLMRSVARLLKPAGRFVFSLSHPCFNNTGMSRLVEEEIIDGDVVYDHALKLVKYASLGPAKGIGIFGQPVAQYYFDRTLSTLLNTCFSAGLYMDGIDEPLLTGEAKEGAAFSWQNFKEFPPALVVRLRRPG
jgi:2-polyprenyl-3-methyl-5-hydroxy-6-metoxy-1,4-benzoquinol methylase